MRAIIISMQVAEAEGACHYNIRAEIKYLSMLHYYYI